MSHNKTLFKLHKSQFNINDKISFKSKIQTTNNVFPYAPCYMTRAMTRQTHVEILLQSTLHTDIQLRLLICTLSIIDGHQHMQKGWVFILLNKYVINKIIVNMHKYSFHQTKQLIFRVIVKISTTVNVIMCNAMHVKTTNAVPTLWALQAHTPRSPP